MQRQICALVMLATIGLQACGGSDSPTAPTSTGTPTGTPTTPTSPPVSMSVTLTVTSGTSAFRGLTAGDATVDGSLTGEITVTLTGGGEILDSVTVMIEGQTSDGTPFDAEVPFGTVTSSSTELFQFLQPPLTLLYPGADRPLQNVVVSGSGIDPTSGDTVMTTNPPIDVDSALVDILLPPPCAPDGETVCLLDGRFRIDVQFTEGGVTGPGGVFASGSVDPVTDDVLFFFSNPSDPALRLEVSDHCNDNGFFWVALTPMIDLTYDITGEDTQTGVRRSYSNQLGEPVAPLLDTTAFETCP